MLNSLWSIIGDGNRNSIREQVGSSIRFRTSEVEREYYAAFQELATQYKAFLGHAQTFHSWLQVVMCRYGLGNLDLALSAFKIAAHTDLAYSKDSELLPRFQEFIQTLKKIDSLSKDLEALAAQGMTQEPSCQA
jgi:hypothetical protein